MFILDSKPVEKNQYIKCNTFENLTVVPYIRGRLVFAELAVRAIEEGEFDLTVVDLPYFMNDKAWLDIPIRLFPYVSSLVIKKDDSTFVTFPFVPNDAPCAAITAAKRMKDTGRPIEIQCVDDSNVINYPGECLYRPAIKVKDDYFVFTEGIEDYYATVFKQLDNVWHPLSYDQRFFSEYRAGIISERLRQCLRQGRNTLFVCEYQTWWLVSKLLNGEKAGTDKQFFHQWKGVNAALVIDDPYLFWANGILDDYPVVVSLFYERLHLGTLGSFDKLCAIDGVIKSIVQTHVGNGLRCPSLRELISFQQYLRKRLVINRTLTPSFLQDLYDSAQSCLGKGIAKEIARQILNYPYPEKDHVLNYFNIQHDNVVIGDPFDLPDLSEATYFYTGTNAYSMDHLYGNSTTSRKRREFLNKNYPRITNIEAKDIGKPSGMDWAVADDYILHAVACDKARYIVKKKREKETIMKSHGYFGDGIHWKATIDSRAKGENAIYIRKKRELLKGNPNMIDEFTPVVFLFVNEMSRDYVQTISDFNITQRLMALGKKDLPLDTLPPPDYVYSVLYTASATEVLYKGHIYKKRLSSISFLYTRHVMGVERYTGITKRPARFQCRINPLSDPELEDFSYIELGIAWAIKYAEDSVLLVARDGWQASRELEDFARVNKVRIIHTALSNYSHDFIERMRTLYFTSTSLKNYPERDKILRRFIE